jgi:Holliday junction resolvase RusA-like endonuclease
VAGKRYQVDVVIYLAAGQKGDVDNFGKVVLDSLKDAKVIKSDAWVQALSLKKERDAENPRTEFRVRTI